MSDPQDDFVAAMAHQKAKDPTKSVTGLSEIFKRVKNQIGDYFLMRRIDRIIAKNRAKERKPK